MYYIKFLYLRYSDCCPRLLCHIQSVLDIVHSGLLRMIDIRISSWSLYLVYWNSVLVPHDMPFLDILVFSYFPLETQLCKFLVTFAQALNSRLFESSLFFFLLLLFPMLLSICERKREITHPLWDEVEIIDKEHLRKIQIT